jgi:hypothetical protein
VACTSAGASVTHEHALETREPSYVPRTTKHFFIPVAPVGGYGHVAAPELPSQQGRASSRGTRGSIGAPLLVRQSAEPWDVAAPELPSQEGRARSPGTRGSTRAHLSKEVRSRAEGHVAAPELTSARRRGPGPWDTWQLRSPPLQGGVVRSYNIRGSAWMHALILVLT